VVDEALAIIKSKAGSRESTSYKTILLTPKGKIFDQKMAKRLAKIKEITLICGHYEGFDERVRKLVDAEVSIGQYILTGGEIPAMVITDAVARLITGVLGKNKSHQEESFSMEKLFLQDKKIKNLKLKIKNCLEYPQYTRPDKFIPKSKKNKQTLKVPDVLTSGNHEKIKKWRLEQAVKLSQKRQKINS
jgi:tRNA (guanine37-N1)-methyltransferase